MQQHLIYIFMIVILIMVMVIKEISKTHFVTRSDTIMWKRKKKNVKILANKMEVYIIIRMVNHKQDICSHMVAQWFYDDVWKKP